MLGIIQNTSVDEFYDTLTLTQDPGRMIRLIFTLLLVFFLCFDSESLFGQREYDNYQISLLTHSPGEELYSVFGHSSLRVKDGSGNSDLVFNYGTFDFDDPHFYFSFVKGRLKYRLSRVPFAFVARETEQDNRMLIETPLNLRVEDKARFIQYLEMNYLPENRSYLYDFLYNNCSTKIIELIDFSTQNRTVYNPMIIPQSSFRELLDPFLARKPWVEMGIDLLMGMPADRLVNGVDAAFLPDYLHLLVKNARIAGISRPDHSLGQTDNILVNAQQETEKLIIQPAWILWPLVLILLISAVLGSYLSGLFRFVSKWFAFIVSGLGILMLALWIFTDHYIFNFNTDLLWANPLLLPLLIFIRPGKDESLNRWGTILYGIMAVIVFIGAVSAFLIEENTNLTATGCIILIYLLTLIMQGRKKAPDPLKIS